MAIVSELDRVIGTLKTPWKRVYDGESNMGNWTADVMIRLTGRDIAFINSGGFRRDVPAGPITVRCLWEVHPFNNRLMGFDLSGEELRRAMSHQARMKRDLLQIGGMRYRVKRGTGQILELRVGDKPVESDRFYSVVTNEYVTGHAEKYFGFDLGDREVIDLGWIDRELVQKAFEQEGVVHSRKDGRIVLEDSENMGQ